MGCVSSCTGEHFITTYTLNSDPEATVDFCRPTTYFVNTNSEQNMELGTIEYPFRDINLVFLELHNIHQHTNRTININVMELTDNYIPIDFIKIVNISHIIIDTYTNHILNNPYNTNFRLVDSIVNFTSSKTMFNIINSTTKCSINTSQMSSHEINDLSEQSLVIFHIHRSSISFNHINVYSLIQNPSTNVLYLYTSY